MSTFRSGGQARDADYGKALRVATVTAVIIGVALLALITFRISYSAIHSVVLVAGVPPAQAGMYPLILDGMLVIASLAGIALHNAEWWMRGYAWFLALSLLATMSVLDASHAAGIGLPHRPAAVMMALIPWVLLLLGLGLLLGVLRHLRATRAVTPASTEHRSVNENVSQPVNGQPSAAVTPSWNRPASDGAQQPSSPQPKLTVALTEPAAGLAESPVPPESADGLAEPDGPDVRPLPTGPKPGVAAAGPAELDDPDVPHVRLLPPGPKPAADSGGLAEADEPDVPLVRLLPPGPKPDADSAG
jgi:uncharacterized protein DUF2637